MSTVSTTQSTTDAVMASLARKESTTSTTSAEDQQMKFLRLLTTQLKNQDPMNPMDNAEMTSQLAQISTVEGVERLNTTVQSLLSSQEDTDSLMAASLVGRGVLVEGRGLTLTEAGGVGGFEIQEGADQVSVTITDANGLEVAVLDLGSAEAGSHNFFWDGLAADGTQAATGAYRITVTATAGGEALDVTELEFGQVTSAIRGPVGTDLQVGDLGVFSLDDIKQIL